MTIPSAPFGDVLRRLRLAAGLTQEELADRAGLSARAVSDLERGLKHRPRKITVQLLSEALELSGEDAERFATAARQVADAGEANGRAWPAEDGEGRRSVPHAEAPASPPLPVLASSRERVRDLTAPTVPPAPVIHPNNLPDDPTPFIGREAEIQAVVGLLSRPTIRLVTLIGTGGIGKTRLSIQVGRALLESFHDGVFFVPLAPLIHAALVPAAIAEALGVQEAGAADLLATLALYLRDKRLLLILDNYEHVLDAATAVSSLLDACRELSIVVTSRAPLHLLREREYPVPPLAIPGAGRPLDPEEVARYDAVALFTERVQAIKPDFRIIEENAAAVAEICRRLDGVPLAIELAARRIRLFPPQAILQRLSRRLDLLSDQTRDRPHRHQTLRAALDWSFSLLTEQEQTVLARLSVFAGGCTLEAAEAVCASESDLNLLGALSGLLEASLLAQVGRAEPRFSMLETLREYGGERLSERGEEEIIRAAHAAYFTALAEEAEPELTGAEQAVWLDRLEQEHGNLSAALSWTLQGEPGLGLRLAGALWRFWYVRGHATEGRRWLEDVLEAGHDSERDGAALARALKGAGVLAQQQGDYERARELHEESLRLSRGLGNEDGIASALNNLGIVAWLQGDLDRAATLLDESLRLRRALGDKSAIAGSLSNLGIVAKLRGDYVRATELQLESLRLSRELGDRASIAHTLNNLGVLSLLQAKSARANELFEECLQLNRELGDKNGIAGTLDSLGVVALREGDYERAAKLHDESLRLLQELGNKDGMAVVLINLAAVAEVRQEHDRAARLLSAAATTLMSLGTVADDLNRETLEDVSRAAREALGSEAFEAAWQQGRTMTLEQALADVLGER